jgi:uncharacterized protein YjbJ (UPF0337 family)
MDWNVAAGDRDQLKRSLQRRWARLAGNDLDRVAGKVAGQREILIGRLRELYGFTPQRAEAEVRDWERHQEPIPPPGLPLDRRRAAPPDGPRPPYCP